MKHWIQFKTKTSRKNYHNFSGKILADSLLVAKGNLDLENKIVYHSYNSKGLPALVSKQDGTLIYYSYNSDSQVTLKIENFQSVSNEIAYDKYSSLQDNDCSLHEQFPYSLVTRYFYESAQGLVTKIIDPRCYKTTYHYDPFNRLKHVKDKDGNILSQNQYNYKN